VLEITRASAERQTPPCPHFGRCGGCQLQHWADAPYLAWKREEVIRALGRRGVDAPVDDMVVAWGDGRRRASLHAERTKRGVALGFVERGGARIAAIDACPVLSPQLAGALPGVRAVAEFFAPARGELSLACLETDAGVDVNIKGAGRAAALDRDALERAARLAEAGDLARLSLDGEPLVARRTPRVAMGKCIVQPPPGAFLQATRAGEEALARLALDALAGAGRVIDLFSGCGTFALRAAEFAELHAVEGDVEALAALKRAADGAGGALKTACERRFRRWS
jgi:23S rRNA (uracil1939-C5)-methyltransferase